MKAAAFVSLLLAGVFTGQAYGQVSAEAFNNGTIQPSGPRTGGNGKNFFNIEGGNNLPNFASWGVADFHGADFGTTVTGVKNVKLILTEADAAFSAPGTIHFYISSDTTTSIDPGTSPLIYQQSVTPPGVGTQLPLDEMGTGTFNTTGNTASGQVDTYDLNLDAAAQALIVNAVNNGGVIRIVIDEDVNTPGVAATYAGFSHNTFAGPTLQFDPVTSATVDPSSFSLFRGSLVSGGLTSLFNIDSDYLQVKPGITLNAGEAPVQLIVDGVSPTPTASDFRFDLVSHTDTGGLQQTIDLFDWTANAYVNLDTRAGHPNTDETVEVTPSNPNRFIQAGTNAVRARISYKSTGIVLHFPWNIFYNQTIWKITG